jgi:hypothetical protein
MGMPRREAFLVARSELRIRTALVLETIARGHQIAVLERNRTRRPCLRRSDRLLWILLSRWWPEWRDSPVMVQPEETGRALSDPCPARGFERWPRLGAPLGGSTKKSTPGTNWLRPTGSKIVAIKIEPRWIRLGGHLHT